VGRLRQESFGKLPESPGAIGEATLQDRPETEPRETIPAVGVVVRQMLFEPVTEGTLPR